MVMLGSCGVVLVRREVDFLLVGLLLTFVCCAWDSNDERRGRQKAWDLRERMIL